MAETPTDDYLRGTFEFYSIPMGESKTLNDDYGFTTVIRVPGGWIFRLHKLRGDEMTSEVVQGIFVPERERPMEMTHENAGEPMEINELLVNLDERGY